VGLHRSPIYLLQRFSARPEKDKLQISHGLGEFVLQNFILGLSTRPSMPVVASLPRRAPLEHTGLFAWWHITRVNLLREMAGDRSARASRSKKVARQHGNGVADSLPSGSGNLDVQLGRHRLPFPYPLMVGFCHVFCTGMAMFSRALKSANDRF
jgi:hypothetical protein